MNLKKIENDLFVEGAQYLCALFDQMESEYVWVVLTAKTPTTLGYLSESDGLAVTLKSCGAVYKLPYPSI